MSSKLTPTQIEQWDESKQGAVIGSLGLILFLTNLSLILRLAAQVRTHRRLFAEDYLICFAVICSDIVIALLLLAVHYGLGLHVWRVIGSDDRPPRHLVQMFQSVWITAVFNGPCFFSIKMSLLFFYRRLFLINQKKLKIFWWINLIYAVMWFIGSTLSFIFQCVPVQFYWERSYLKFPNPPAGIHGECHGAENWQVALPIVFSVISDFALLGLPVFTLVGLNINRIRKAALIAIFSVGLLACFLEVARVIVILVVTDVRADPTYNTVAFLVITSAGEGAAIICACLPLIAAQARHIFQAYGTCWYSRRSKSSHLSPFDEQPIRLGSQGGDSDKTKKVTQQDLSRNSIRGTGTNTHIEARVDRLSWFDAELGDGIRVKTDVELTDD